MKTITFTANEIRALRILIHTNPCSSSCAYVEMVKSKKDCDECKLNDAIWSIDGKL